MKENENKGKDKNITVPKRRRRKLSKFAYALFLITAVFCAAAVFIVFFLKIQTIKVSGQSQYSTKQIIDASCIKLNSNLLRVNKTLVDDKIRETLPYINSAKVKLFPMSTVEIVVTQDQPAYIIQYSGGFIFADSGFKLLEIRAKQIGNNALPLIMGVKVGNVKPGSLTWFSDKPQQNEIKVIADAIKTAQLDHITSIDVTDNYQIFIKYDNRISIILGTPLEIEKKLEVAKGIIKTKLQPTDKGQLDVSTQDKRYTFTPT